jgi:hypothetical protein
MNLTPAGSCAAVATLDTRRRALNGYARVTSVADAPAAFWTVLDRLDAVLEAMTSLFPEWEEYVEPAMVGSANAAAIKVAGRIYVI